MTMQIVRHSFTIHDYAQMLRTGILGEDDRVELIDGEVRVMSPIGPLHVALVNRLTAVLTRLIGEQAIVSVQNPIQLNDYTEPQPDLTLLAPRDDFYSTALAQPYDVLLVIEVADSSLEYDREEKLPRYAASGIAEVWIVDVSAQSIEQHSQPRGGQYRTKRTYEYDEAVTAVSLAGITVQVSQIFR
jgi:Uma2 family endonuclease